MRRHMKLVKARYVKAHHYFAAKNRAAATHKLLGRWNKAFASAARKHAAANRHHKYTWKMMRKAYLAKRRAMHYHHLTVKRLAAAKKHEAAHLRGYHYWNVKWAGSRRSVKKAVHWMKVCYHRRRHALNMYRKAHHLRLRAAKAHKYAYLRMVALKHLRHAQHMHRRAVNHKRAAYKAAIKAHHAVIRHMRRNMHHL